jgi:hypothetical protein
MLCCVTGSELFNVRQRPGIVIAQYMVAQPHDRTFARSHSENSR